MTKTIEQLQAKVAELEEENARLKAECDDIKQVQFPRKLEAVAVGWKSDSSPRKKSVNSNAMPISKLKN
jgi:FtsZ-binding cell division protein ZapB